MCDQEALTVQQWLLLHKAGVPHLKLLQVAGQLRVEDYYYTMRVLHQSWPAGLKPGKTGPQKMLRLIDGKQQNELRGPQVFFFPSQDHI